MLVRSDNSTEYIPSPGVTSPLIPLSFIVTQPVWAPKGAKTPRLALALVIPSESKISTSKTTVVETSCLANDTNSGSVNVGGEFSTVIEIGIASSSGMKCGPYEWNSFLGVVNPGLEGKADMAEMAWMTNDPDTLPFLALRTESWPDQGGFNSGYYSNPKVDELLNAARSSTDQNERARLYQEMQTIVQDDAPWVFVANWKQNAVTNSSVKNFSLQPSFFLLLKDVVKN